MPDHSREQIDAFLAQPLLARLGTCNPATQQPHVTPVWFAWDGEVLTISGFSSTRKMKDVRRNPRISVLVDLREAVDGLTAVLMEGPAELLVEPADYVKDMTRRIYTRYLGEEGVLAAEPQSWMNDPENRLIRLIPEKIYTW